VSSVVSKSLIKPQPAASRWKCVVAYDGTMYQGWQSQEGGNTIQDVIEKQLTRIT
jgi:tRNA pseudouridine(38-40) synthase